MIYAATSASKLGHKVKDDFNDVWHLLLFDVARKLNYYSSAQFRRESISRAAIKFNLHESPNWFELMGYFQKTILIAC